MAGIAKFDSCHGLASVRLQLLYSIGSLLLVVSSNLMPGSALDGMFLATFSPLSIVLHHREWLWIDVVTRGGVVAQ